MATLTPSIYINSSHTKLAPLVVVVAASSSYEIENFTRDSSIAVRATSSSGAGDWIRFGGLESGVIQRGGEDITKLEFYLAFANVKFSSFEEGYLNWEPVVAVGAAPAGASSAGPATVVPTITLTQVEDSTSTVSGTVTGLRWAQAHRVKVQTVGTSLTFGRVNGWPDGTVVTTVGKGEANDIFLARVEPGESVIVDGTTYSNTGTLARDYEFQYTGVGVVRAIETGGAVATRWWGSLADTPSRVLLSDAIPGDRVHQLDGGAFSNGAIYTLLSLPPTVEDNWVVTWERPLSLTSDSTAFTVDTTLTTADATI